MGDTGLAADLSRGPEAWSPAGLLKVPGPQRCPGSDQSNKIALRPRTRRASQSQFFPGRQGRKEGRKKGGRKGDTHAACPQIPALSTFPDDSLVAPPSRQ